MQSNININHLLHPSVYGDLLFPVEGKPIGRALYEMHTGRSRLFAFNFGKSRQDKINIDKSSDCELVSEVKKIIKKMIVYKPKDRISMSEVVALLTVLRDSLSDKINPAAKEVLVAVNEGSVWVRVGSEWEKQPSLPKEHPGYYICYYGVSDGIVAIGGWDGNPVSSMCHHFSVITLTWRRLPDMPTARCAASAFVVRHMLLVLGGRDKHYNNLAVCERLHMTDGVWSSAASMMEPLWKPLIATVAGKVFIVPQHSSLLTGSQMQQYDPTADRFSWAAQLPQHVQDTFCACLVAVSDKLYLLGGSQRLAVQYSPAAAQWTQLQSQPPDRYHGECCVVHGGKLLLVGETEDNQTNLEEFDISTQQWNTTEVKLPFSYISRYSHVSSIFV